ncbi:MAG TPA: carbon starvation CstA 5TM domain-containing protein, partial [Cellvibrionaceae bacterium]|nr:carbon starvation CstA 5TM domain-containing protein [Cellvibrionaceae bacterium]
IYFALNSPAAVIGKTVEEAAGVISQWGFVITPEMLTQMAQDVGEASILSRTGGAPSFALGMANILAGFLGGKALMAFWYHFAILFEALFILTTLDAGTRVCRFLIQDLLGSAVPSLANTQSWGANILATFLAVAGWGYFLYVGVTDPFGGINSLWALFGIANQMLAGIALILVSVLLLRSGKGQYVWISALPAAWILLITLYASGLKLLSADPKIGFLAHAQKYAQGLADGKILPPTQSISQMQQVVFNDYVDAVMTLIFICVVISILGFALRCLWQHRRNGAYITTESVEVTP